MKKTIFTFFLSLFCCWLSAQCPVGSITFTLQSQIDSFHILYPGCQDLPDNLTINGDGISNLNGLLGITSVGGDLSISSNDSLPNLHGLDSLHSIGESLIIARNNTLGSLAGLDNLSSIGEDLKISSNAVLTDISSLKNLTAIPRLLAIGIHGGPFVPINFGNPSLPNLTGLENIQSVENLQILANASLTNLAGLSGLVAVSDIEIIGNASLTDLTGLSGISSASSIRIIANPLTSLAGLHQITSVAGQALHGTFQFCRRRCSWQCFREKFIRSAKFAIHWRASFHISQ